MLPNNFNKMKFLFVFLLYFFMFIETLPVNYSVSLNTAQTIEVKGNGTTENLVRDSKSLKWWFYFIWASVVAILFFFSLFIAYFIFYRLGIKMEDMKQQLRAATAKNKIDEPDLEERLISRLEKQIEPKNVIINFDSILGKGAYATVFKAIITDKVKNEIIRKGRRFSTEIFDEVALKMPICYNNEETDLFIRELDNLMTLGSHPNIITFLGWTHHNNVPCFITELASRNLLQNIKSFRGQILPIKTIISILLQVTQALEHVASLNMVHRDVACRNVLMTEDNVAKLADFGLCCLCDDSFTYHASLQKRLPLKWLSIEALMDHIFSEKSDVWSFGILCYEVFSLGKVPYPLLSSAELIEFLQVGNRLEKPKDTPEEIYKLMLDCWKENPNERPHFKEIGNRLEILLENETAGYGYLKLRNIYYEDK